MPSKTERLLEHLQQHKGQPVCMRCLQVTFDGARLDAVLSNVRHRLGWEVRRVDPVPTCPEHGRQMHVVFTGQPSVTRRRSPLGARERERVRVVHHARDAYLGHTPSDWQADHRVPIQSRQGDEVAIDWADDDDVRANFIVLSVEHNLTKNAKCKGCRRTGQRPPFFGVPFWFEGGPAYVDQLGCNGCGWAFPEAWRAALARRAGLDDG